MYCETRSDSDTVWSADAHDDSIFEHFPDELGFLLFVCDVESEGNSFSSGVAEHSVFLGNVVQFRNDILFEIHHVRLHVFTKYFIEDDFELEHSELVSVPRVEDLPGLVRALLVVRHEPGRLTLLRVGDDVGRVVEVPPLVRVLLAGRHAACLNLVYDEGDFEVLAEVPQRVVVLIRCLVIASFSHDGFNNQTSQLLVAFEQVAGCSQTAFLFPAVLFRVVFQGVLDGRELEFGPVERGDADFVHFGGVGEREGAESAPVEASDHRDHFQVGRAWLLVAHTRIQFLLGVVVPPGQQSVFLVKGGFACNFVGEIAASAAVVQVIHLRVLRDALLDSAHHGVEVCRGRDGNSIPEAQGVVEEARLNGFGHGGVVVADRGARDVVEEIDEHVAVGVGHLVSN